MDPSFTLEVSRYQLGIIAQAVRDKLHADRDGSIALDADERNELQRILEDIQGVVAQT